MFNFLTQNKKGQLVEILDIITKDMTKIQLAGLAEERAINLIANAVAKSEIVLSDGQERRNDAVYYKLNIQPNDNQTGTDFWYNAVYRLLKRGECLIVRIGDKFYLAESFTANNYVLFPKRYTEVVLTDGIDTISLQRSFSAEEVMHLRYRNTRIRSFLENVLDLYNESVNAITLAEQVGNVPKYKFKADANIAFREKTATGEDQRLTITDVIDRLKKQLKSSDLEVIRETNGIEVSYLGTSSGVTASEVGKMAEELNHECAMTYGIPWSVYTGQITENSDASNEFITYAVQPIMEVISDSMNAKLVGAEDYIKGERMFVWAANFKHVDALSNANSIDKLRSGGWTLDEIRAMVGYEPLNTEFSTTRALTKNYAAEGDEESGDDSADDHQAEERVINKPKLSKHKERRLRRERSEQVLLFGSGSKQ